MKLVRCFSAFLLCLCLAVCFTACGGDEKNKSEPRPASSVTETDGETTTETESQTTESHTSGTDAPDTGNTETDKSTDQKTNKRNDETKAADTQKANAGADVVITEPSDSETTGGSEPSGEQKTPDTEQKTPDTSEEPASGIVLPDIDI